MNEVNILEEKPKMKGGFKALLIIIVLLILVAGGCGAYFYFMKNVSSPKAIYTKMLNEFSASMVNALDTADDFKNLNSGTINIEASMTAKDADLKDVSELINNTKLAIDYAVDQDKKAINVKAGTYYSNDNILTPNIYVRGNEIFFEEKSLFDKVIKLDEAELDSMWEAYDFSGTKVIIEEISKILKDNLLDEYFKEESVSKTQTKVSLILDSKNMENYIKAVLNDIKDNNKLLNELAAITNIEKEEIVKDLNDVIKEVTFGDEEELTIDTYINKKSKEIEKVIIDMDGLKVIFDKKDDVKYEISLSMSGQNITLGTLTVKDNLLSVNINFSGLMFEYTISTSKDNNEISVAYEAYGTKGKLKMSGTSEKGNINANIVTDEVTLNVDADYTAATSKVTVNEIKDYVKVDELSEQDMTNIYTNIYKNEKLSKLITTFSK